MLFRMCVLMDVACVSPRRTHSPGCATCVTVYSWVVCHSAPYPQAVEDIGWQGDSGGTVCGHSIPARIVTTSDDAALTAETQPDATASLPLTHAAERCQSRTSRSIAASRHSNKVGFSLRHSIFPLDSRNCLGRQTNRITHLSLPFSASAIMTS